MWLLLRIALIWLVALAVPVQGVAAATMVFCGPGDTTVGHQRAAHDHAAHEHHASHDVDAASPDAANDATSDATSTGFDTTSCSVCAACCTAATLPSPLVSCETPKGHAVYRAALASWDATFLTSGLDRPPRLTLA
jgi:hypothetical protein